MKINAHAFAFAASASVAFWFIVCAALMYVWPDYLLQLVAPLAHMTSLELFRPYFQVTLQNAASGTIQWFIYTYLITCVFAHIYNRMIK